MPHWLRLCALSFALALVLTTSVGIGGVRAGEAGLVVEHGDGSITYVLVTFPEDEIASIELLQRSGLSLTTVSSGGLGEAICSLDREGCGVEDCRLRLCQTGSADSPFWKFFRVGSGGTWIAQPLGASGTRVYNGVVDLWAWTGGESELEPVDIQTVIQRTSAPADRGLDDVYVARFDAAGNPVGLQVEEETGQDILIGAIALLAIVLTATFLIRKRASA
jgi:hypothetical protein